MIFMYVVLKRMPFFIHIKITAYKPHVQKYNVIIDVFLCYNKTQ